MNTATPQRTAPRPIKGSWEDLHEQAQQLARNSNDDAIPIYQRIVNGLAALPPAARAAGDNRLYNLMMTTGVEMQGYLNLRDRYDESLAITNKLLTLVAETDRPQLVELKSDVLLQAGRGDEAIAILHELVESADADTGDWGRIVAAHIRNKEPEKVFAEVDAMGAWLDKEADAGLLEGADLTEARYYQQRLKGAALLELGRFDEVEAIFNHLYPLGGADAFSPHLLYTRLVGAGVYDQALEYIYRDQARPVRAAFWRGLAYRYKGDTSRATKTWQAAMNDDLLRGDQESIVEHLLTRFYLGDPQGEGVEMMLRAQREQTRISWMIFLLTGLGWIVRGDDNAAHSNFRLAVAQVKSMGEGKVLPRQYWRFVKDLTPADRLAQYTQYFDTEAEPQTATSAESTITEPPMPESGTVA